MTILPKPRPDYSDAHERFRLLTRSYLARSAAMRLCERAARAQALSLQRASTPVALQVSGVVAPKQDLGGKGERVLPSGLLPYHGDE